MKKTLWNLLLTLPIFGVLLILTASIKALANEERTLLPLSKVDTSESAGLININPKLVQATPQLVNQS
ncbi:MAG: hypothetical protein ICV54_30905, partial [Nostoc sp. C3-bin3]|nr:hypothetical protein [Nostoc sp. C3-bin3]